MIKFKRAVLHNFLSYHDAELNLDNQGVTLIEGVNNSNDAYTSSGSGKSSLLSAITYALYGRTVTGLTSNAVINKEVGTDCCVELYFDIDDDKYCIKRYRKGKKGNANKVRLYLNDKEITEATNPKTDDTIQTLIGIQFNTYVNTISYGSSDEPVFSQATDKGKKEILENLANTTVYAQAKSVASDKLKEFKLELSNIEQQIVNHNNMISQYKALDEQEQERYAQEEERHKQDKATLDDLKLARDNYAEESGKRLRELENAENEVLASEPNSDGGEKLKQAHAALRKIDATIAETNQKITTATNKINDLRKQYKDIANKTVCPVCGHKLDESHKQKELDSIVKQATTAKSELAQSQESLTKAKAIRDKWQPAVDKLESSVNSFNKQYKEFQDKLQNIRTERSDIKMTINQYDLKINGLESFTGVAIAPAKCYNNNIKAEEEKLAKAEQEKDELNKKIANYEILATKVFSKEGITSVVLDLITPYLNEHANYYLNKLSGSILTINMNTQKLNANKTLSDKFDLQVHNQAGADSYQNCSAGERKRIDIAIAFAIQDLQQDHSNTATNIAIYDECFDGLDSIGCESVIEILKEKAKTIPSIFVITHNETLKPLFDNAIKVTKSKQGISTVGA